MLNQVVIVGRLVSDIELIEGEEGKYAEITLAVPRVFKNAEGNYDTDFIKASIFNGIAENSAKYCKKGDLIGVKGRLETNDQGMHLLAEKITFLSSTHEEE
jgi:single-strand DNA-binding protein